MAKEAEISRHTNLRTIVIANQRLLTAVRSLQPYYDVKTDPGLKREYVEQIADVIAHEVSASTWNSLDAQSYLTTLAAVVALVVTEHLGSLKDWTVIVVVSYFGYSWISSTLHRLPGQADDLNLSRLRYVLSDQQKECITIQEITMAHIWKA